MRDTLNPTLGFAADRSYRGTVAKKAASVPISLRNHQNARTIVQAFDLVKTFVQDSLHPSNQQKLRIPSTFWMPHLTVANLLTRKLQVEPLKWWRPFFSSQLKRHE
jgi:hypothetical protein